MMRAHVSSPLVGEAGGGPAASAAEKTPWLASSATANDAPPPNPPRKGEGFKRLTVPPGAIERARRLRANMTKAERALWAGLRQAQPQLHWRRQVPLGPYVADFCSHRARLVVELDGGQHAAEASQAYDTARTRFIEGEGYRVFRFWNNDVLSNLDGVLAAIAESTNA